MGNTLFGLPVQEDDTLPSAKGVTFGRFSYPVRAVYAHPSMINVAVGDTFEGLPVIRDERIPPNEIYIHTGEHIIKMTYKEKHNGSI